jgi:hypothetical protein
MINNLSNLGSLGRRPVIFPGSSGAHSWPFYPVALSGTTYFVLSEDYMVEGFGGPERIGDYISYCRAYGVFRKTPVHVPTRNEAERDLSALLMSQS